MLMVVVVRLMLMLMVLVVLVVLMVRRLVMVMVLVLWEGRWLLSRKMRMRNSSSGEIKRMVRKKAQTLDPWWSLLKQTLALKLTPTLTLIPLGANHCENYGSKN